MYWKRWPNLSRAFQSLVGTCALLILLTGVYSFSAVSQPLSCYRYYFEKGPSYLQFNELLVKHFNTSKDLNSVSYLVNESVDDFARFHSRLTEKQRSEFMGAIQRGYVEVVTAKNKGSNTMDIYQVKRAMDAFLNLEMDRLTPNIHTIADLKAAFSKINRFIGFEHTIDFNSALEGAQFLQKKLQKLRTHLPDLKERLRTTKNNLLYCMFSPHVCSDLENLVADLEAGRSGDSQKIWIYGSVVNGRGIKDVSDLDYHLHDRISMITYTYFKNVDDPGLIRRARISHIEPLGADPMQAAPETLLVNSRWVLEVTAAEINFLIYEPKTQKFRRLK